MIINVHAGHCPDGSGGASGAVGIIKESTENRKIAEELIEYLRAMGHTVYDCTCNTAETKMACLQKIVAACNSHEVAIDISIHFNDADPQNKVADGKQLGTEVWAKNYNGVKDSIANAYLKGMQELGFKSRGKKESNNLYFLNRTNAMALLFEICFVGDADDVELYKKVGPSSVARVLAEAITGEKVPSAQPTVQTIKAGDTVRVKVSTIKLYDRGDSKAVCIGNLYNGVEKTVVKLNSKGTKAKLADGFWISTKNVEVV